MVCPKCPAVIMWKTITRGFRETFERGLNLGWNPSNPRVQENQCTRYYQYCGRPVSCLPPSYTRQRRERCSREGSAQEEGAKEEGTKNYGTYDAFDSWLGAVSCSSALALGWVLSQPSTWKRWLSDHSCSGGHRSKSAVVITSPAVCSTPAAVGCHHPPPPPSSVSSLLRVLTRVAVSQPTPPPPPPPPPPLDLPRLLTNNDTIGSDELQYGPPTAEEALNEAANNFLKVHNSIFGEVENRQAISLIEGPKKDARQAVRLFYSASKKGYIPASFNLGQCYELGIGTKQDFREAAKWYKKASENGHPTATYNLAVFTAHGWGGLVQDSSAARQLLERAASLGQTDAAAALGLSSSTSPPPPSPLVISPTDDSMKKCEPPRIPPLQEISADPNEIYKLASSIENTPCEDTNQPHLILALYKMASELGHKEAKSKYQILQAYETVGLLTEYLCRGSKPTLDCTNMKFSAVF